MVTKNSVYVRLTKLETFSNEHTIQIDEALYETWKLINYETLYLQFGQRKVQCTCKPIKDKNKKIIQISEQMSQQLMLPVYPVNFQLSFNSLENTLHLGPVIAVLTKIFPNKTEICGHLTRFCEELALYSSQSGADFFVTNLDLMNVTDRLFGYRYMDHTWVKYEVPFPDVIHNRLNTRKLEASPKWEKLTNYCNTHNIPYFNDHFLNKWEVHKAIQDSNEIAPYLPETICYENFGNIEWMIEKHQYLFIKPIHGNQGKRIYRIYKSEEGYQLDFTTFNGNHSMTFHSFHRLHETLSERIHKNYYIIQQGLHLMTYNHRALDFRLLCNRNNQGSWKIASAVARVSGKEQFVSNIARGGELLSVDDVLLPFFNDKKAKELKHFLIELALEVAEIVGQEIHGIYGELGVDLAIDTNGHPWLIEVNTKPSKDLDSERKNLVIRPSARGIIEYASYLANLPVKE